MTLRLDGRQRAMLAEMGLRVEWLPDSPVAIDEPEADDVAVECAASDSVAQCLAAPVDRERLALHGAGDPRPDWLVIGDAPSEGELPAGEPFPGPPGRLLDNMLRAVGLARGRKVYLAHLAKVAPGAAPQDESLAAQVQRLQPKVILAMGRFAVQALTGSDEPLGKLRGRAHQFMGSPLVVTYDPAYLLRNHLPEKAKAWADLCLAQALIAQRG
jgi:uracil-DNA glycosylase family 4